MARLITGEEKQVAQELVERARGAMKCIEDYDQEHIDRLCRAVGWATSNAATFTRLANMSVDETGLGDRAGRPNKRFKLPPQMPQPMLDVIGMPLLKAPALALD